MIVFCNGKERQVEDDCMLSDLLARLELNPKTVVVECNKVIVNPEEYADFILPELARLELIRFVGGG